MAGESSSDGYTESSAGPLQSSNAAVGSSSLQLSSSSSSGVSVKFFPHETNYIPDQGAVEISYIVSPPGASATAYIGRDFGEGNAAFDDGLATKVIGGEGVLLLKGLSVSSKPNNISLRAAQAIKPFTVIRAYVQGKVKEVQNGKWLPEHGSIDNLAAVWPNDEIGIRVRFLPAEYKDHMPADFLKWKSPNAGEHIPPNTLEHSFRLVGGIKRIEVFFSRMAFKKLIFVDTPEIGEWTEGAVARRLILRWKGFYIVDAIRAYADEATIWGRTFPNPQRDAMKHSYWMALCASDPDVGAEAGLLMGKGHERKAPQEPFQSTMDLHNNFVGSQTVHTHRIFGPVDAHGPDREAIQADLLRKYREGILWIWEGNPKDPTFTDGLVCRSNRVKIFPPEETIM